MALSWVSCWELGTSLARKGSLLNANSAQQQDTHKGDPSLKSLEGHWVGQREGM